MARRSVARAVMRSAELVAVAAIPRAALPEGLAPREYDSLDALLPDVNELDEVERAPRLAPRVCLADLPLGATAILGEADGLNTTILRLLEMGLTPGTPLTLTRRAPGGDPIEVRVRGTRLCVRRADLARFQVRSVSLPTPRTDRDRK